MLNHLYSMVRVSYARDDPTQVLSLLAEHDKFDFGASRCMPGDPDRIDSS